MTDTVRTECLEGAAGQAARPRLERSSGTVRLVLGPREDRTVLRDLYQEGSMAVRFPRGVDSADLEAVMVNKAGGLTGGDSTEVTVLARSGARACVTSQANEKIYRAASGVVRSSIRLELEAGAGLVWIPQPTILFSGAQLDRSFSIDSAQEARLLLVESVILGRAAMGETFDDGRFSDHWRLRSQGALLYADELCYEPTQQNASSRSSTLADSRAMTTLLYLAPDAEERLDEFRTALYAIAGESGASYRDGFIHGIAVAPTARTLMVDLALFSQTFLGRPVPRVWSC